MANRSSHILPTIVLAQFACTSLWFAGNAVMPDLMETYQLSESALGHITSAVNFGFILGTLVYAILTLSDRFSPSKVFFVSAMAAAVANLGIIFDPGGLPTILTLRLLTGFFLAGIYPVGMKIASDYFEKGLGKALGFLVGALVLGKASPHLIKSYAVDLPWEYILIATSSLALLGGLVILLFVPDGPFRKQSQGFDARAIFKVFRKKEFRSAAFGYFGHMWELYAFWGFIPLILRTYAKQVPGIELPVSFLSFAIIGIGGIGCMLSGLISQKWGSKRIAFFSLMCSGLCCVFSPLLFSFSIIFLIIFLLFWGLTVVADSPLFSTLVARHAPMATRGTALTIVNSIGFAISIVSIQLLTGLLEVTDPRYLYVLLGFGPLFGLIALFYPNENLKS